MRTPLAPDAVAVDLSGSVEAEHVALFLGFVAGLGRTGRLQVRRGLISGAVDLRDGTVIGVSRGTERGLEALDALLLAPGQAEFSFGAAAPLAEVPTLTLSRALLLEHVSGLAADMQRIAVAVPSLSAVPRRNMPGDPDDVERPSLSALQVRLLLACDGTQSVAALLHAIPFGAGLKAFADLAEAGWIVWAQPAEETREVNPKAAPVATPTTPTTATKTGPSVLRRVGWVVLAGVVVVLGAAQVPDMFPQMRAALAPLRNGQLLQPSSVDSRPGVVWPSNPAGRFWLTNDGFHLAPSPHDTVLAVSPPLIAYQRDISVAARFRTARRSSDATYGFLIRDEIAGLRDGAGYDGRYLLLGVTEAGQPVVRRRNADQWIEMSDASDSAPAQPIAATRELELVAIGTRVTLRVNGSVLTRIEDAAPAAGGIALYAEASGAEIVVDDFRFGVPACVQPGPTDALCLDPTAPALG